MHYKCFNCNTLKSLTINDKFCGDCGEFLRYTCRNCRLRGDSVYCKKCGDYLIDTAAKRVETQITSYQTSDQLEMSTQTQIFSSPISPERTTTQETCVFKSTPITANKRTNKSELKRFIEPPQPSFRKENKLLFKKKNTLIKIEMKH